MWTSYSLSQGPPDYETGRTNKSIPRGEGFSERNVLIHAICRDVDKAVLSTI